MVARQKWKCQGSGDSFRAGFTSGQTQPCRGRRLNVAFWKHCLCTTALRSAACRSCRSTAFCDSSTCSSYSESPAHPQKRHTHLSRPMLACNILSVPVVPQGNLVQTRDDCIKMLHGRNGNKALKNQSLISKSLVPWRHLTARR